MFELIKKTLLTGIGLAVVTKEEVQKLGRELVEKGELTQKEGKELVDDLLRKSEQAQKDMESKVHKLVQDAVEKLNVVTKKDIAELVKRIDRLEGTKGNKSE
ncbi:MAG: polyhydroxyalkanoate synthesis regulator [Candidatus Latescibacteria bacterium]|jgi:polyhydroxyalkanoate synthesis regulator phasin|nr:polyhydroxyalkanoate synthesis regulator [Candidatus Latescibacterota bacterium]